MRTDSPDNITRRAASPAGKRFALAASLAGLWLIGLSVLSLLTANPVTLNRDQVLKASDVLTAVVEEANSGQIRVEKSWKNAVRDMQLTLQNLHETKPTSGERLLIPVTSSTKEWLVTPSKLPREPPLVYPASDESERQLRHLLKTGHLP